MARTFDSTRLRHQKRIDARLTAEHRQLARAIASLVIRAGIGHDANGASIIPLTRATRDRLKTTIWEQVLKPYYIGQGTDALRGPSPQSPYALLLVEGIEGAIRIQAERQAAIVRRLVRDRDVLQWITGPRNVLAVGEMNTTQNGRNSTKLLEIVGNSTKLSVSGRITELTTIRPGADPLVARTLAGGIFAGDDVGRFVRPRGMYDSYHEWVDPNGYRLSDRIWRTSIDVRSRIDLMLDTEIARGTSAVDIADLIEPFLTPGALQQRTNTPYGTEGSYAARRLARTEITANAGRAAINASTANPFVNSMQWRTSGSHSKFDECDMKAHGGPNGDGIYPLGQVPQYPSHPNCLCSLLPVPVGEVADLIATLREDIQAARGTLIGAVAQGNPRRARTLQGILNPEYLTRAIMNGNLDEAVARAVAEGAGESVRRRRAA